MNKTMKIFAILAIAVLLVSFMSTNIFATDPGSIIGTLENDVNRAEVNTSKISSTAGKVIKAIRNFAIIASVVILVILGVKYMIGSVEQKAEYQKNFVPLIIGIVLVVGATSIASFLFSIV